MGDQSLIIGLLAKREEPRGGNAELRERVAILSNDIEAQDRVSGRTGGLHAPRGASSCSTAPNCGTPSWPSYAKQRSL